MKYTIFFLFFFSGCSLTQGIKKFLTPYKPSQQIKVVESAQEETTPKKELTILQKENSSSYKEQKKILKHKKRKTTYKKIVQKRKKRINKNFLKEEPFSIKSKKEDPELLGPQTTWKTNPLTQKRVVDKKEG